MYLFFRTAEDASQASDGSSSYRCSSVAKVPQLHSLRPRQRIQYRLSSDPQEPHEDTILTPTRDKMSRAAYMKRYRTSLTHDQKDRLKETARRRMKVYREIRKERGADQKTLTHHAKIQQRQMWKEAKQKQRINMTPRQKDLFNLKRRKQYLEKKMVNNIHLHNSTSKFADQLDLLISTATPRKPSYIVGHRLPSMPYILPVAIREKSACTDI